MTIRVHFSVYYFLNSVCILSYITFISCVFITVIKDFKRSNMTHCKVFNVLPSMSAMIASFEPQRFIWRLNFALNSAPRYIIGYLQMRRLLSRHHVTHLKFYRIIQGLNGSFHFLELTSLLILTYISSKEIKTIHEYSFICFMLFSLLHMLLTVLIDYWWPRTKENLINQKEKSVRWKRLKLFLSNMLSFLIAVYFFYRHNKYCEPYIYSIYALFEYIIILTNIAYHSLIRYEWDQHGGQIQIFY